MILYSPAFAGAGMDNLPVHKVAGIKLAKESIESNRSVGIVSSAVFSRPEPDRDGICEARGAVAKGIGAHCQEVIGSDRRTAAGIHQRRVSELPHSSGLRVKLIGKRSKMVAAGGFEPPTKGL